MVVAMGWCDNTVKDMFKPIVTQKEKCMQGDYKIKFTLP